MSEIANRTRSSQRNEPSTSAASSDEPNPSFNELVQSVRKMEADQTIFKQAVMDNFNALKLEISTLVAASESTQNEGNGRKRKREDIGESAEVSSEKKDASDEQKQIVPQEHIPAKSFVLKHNFEKVSDLKEKDLGRAAVEEHFGVAWGMNMDYNKEHLGLYLKCVSRGNYCIEISCTIELKNKSGTTIEKILTAKFTENDKIGLGLRNILKWDDLVENYSINDTLAVKMQIQIIKMVGVYKENLRDFGPTMADCSDVALVVKDQKFFVSKLYLASQSPYFKGLLLGNFRESKETEVVLKGIDPDDFQNYLEALYGEPAIDETTVEGILLVADMSDTPLISRKCEEYLIEKSKKSNKNKMELSIQYKLNKLQKDCLDNIKSMEDFRSTVPSNVRGLGQSLTTVLLEKTISLN
ncbi:unnamed protein product [Caenorhabditis brenneri]